ncbi:hypothetical protein HMPREF3218_0202236 [Prevotella bivia]|nr:hypothetical protein HMPREF3218_0202236 [Prevotella bivia]
MQSYRIVVFISFYIATMAVVPIGLLHKILILVQRYSIFCTNQKNVCIKSG